MRESVRHRAFMSFLFTAVAVAMVSISFAERLGFGVGNTCIRVKVDNVRIREDVFLHAFFNDTVNEDQIVVDVPKLELPRFLGDFMPSHHAAFKINKEDPPAGGDLPGAANLLPTHILEGVTRQSHTEVGVFPEPDSSKPGSNLEVAGNAALHIVPAGNSNPSTPDDCVLDPVIPVKPGTLADGDMELTGAPRDGGSLNLRFNTVNDTNTYYKAIDPGDKRNTLRKFKILNGFLENGKIHDKVVSAKYFNAGDLGFGRLMVMRKQEDGDVAYYVSNFARAEQAVAAWKAERKGKEPPAALATVAMEYSPIDPEAPECSPTRLPTCKRITKFYFYEGGGLDVTRDIAVDLDGRGARGLPGKCTVCHGGKEFVTKDGEGQPIPDPDPDLGARFIPFDVDAFGFVDKKHFRRRNQERSFKKLNLRILETNPAPAVRELICGWYWPQGSTPNPTCEANDLRDGNARKTQNSAFVPTGWSAQPQHLELYNQVVKRSCRTCHVQREEQDFAIDFNTFSEFEQKKGLIQLRVCRELHTPMDGKTSLLKPDMPHARWTFLNFWLNPSPQVNPVTNLVELSEQPAVLSRLLGFSPPCGRVGEFRGFKGDMNRDGKVDKDDKPLFLDAVKEYQKAFNTTAVVTYPHPLDLNGDGSITEDDADDFFD